VTITVGLKTCVIRPSEFVVAVMKSEPIIEEVQFVPEPITIAEVTYEERGVPGKARVQVTVAEPFVNVQICDELLGNKQGAVTVGYGHPEGN